jgi:hypothetical protein
MFKKIFREIRAGRTFADAVEILVRTYDVPITDEVYNIISRRLHSNTDFYNEHDLAVIFLIDIARYSLDPANPMAKKVITEWIHRAKGAESRGLLSRVSRDYVLNHFLEVVEERFGIDHTKIDAA